MNYILVNKQTHKIAPVLKHKKLLFTSNGSAMTFYNDKLCSCIAETAKYGYDDIHSCCHHYGYGNFAPQLRTLAGTMDAFQNAILLGVT